MVCTIAHHGGDDAEGRHAVGQLVDGLDRNIGVLLVGLDFVVHQVFELVGVHRARDDQAQVVGDEVEQVSSASTARCLSNSALS
jgi:hypothetical protein